MGEEIRRTVGFVFEMGALKRYRRTGWSLAGVPDPESIADHSFRAGVIAAVLAEMEGADPTRAAFLVLWHDSQEARTTDIPHLAKRHVRVEPHEATTADQVAGLPGGLAKMIAAAVAEYEEGRTPEARCARDADKLECLVQAREYQDQGHAGVVPWIESSVAALATDSARRLAAEAAEQHTLAWLRDAHRPE